MRCRTIGNEEADELLTRHGRLVAEEADKVVGRFGGDRDDALSDGMAALIRAAEHHDATRGGFEKFARYCVFKAVLRSKSRLRLLRERKRREAETRGFELRAAPEPFDARRLLLEISEDAATVLRLLFEPPPGLSLDAAERRQGEGAGWRWALMSHLRDLGWCAVRIGATFDEIREALR